MSDIGKPLKRHHVIPLREAEPAPEKAPAPEQKPEREKEDA